MAARTSKGSAVELALEVWGRRRFLAIVVFALIVAAVGSLAKFLPDVYRSTATVLVERHQVPETFVRSSITGELETRLQTISQEILSRARLEDVIKRLDLYADMRKRAPMETAVEKMRRDIQLVLKGVEQMSGRSATVAFDLSYRGRDPETVARVTNTLASLYVDENSRIRERQASQTAQFLKAQLDEARARLDEQEARVQSFRARHTGELPQQMAVNMATVERLQGQLHLNNANQLRAIEQRAALVKQLAESNPAGVGGPEGGAVRLAKLKAELAELRVNYSEKYPDIVRVKRQIEALERELAESKDDGSATASRSDLPTPLWKTELDRIDTEIKALKLEEQRLRSQIETYQRRIENAPQREQEFQELSRGVETARELHASLLKRYEDAQLAESMEQSGRGELFRLLDPALPPKEPAAPNRIRLGILGVLLAIGAAVAAAAVAEHLDTSFHTHDDLRAFTRVPVLASIPLIVGDADTARQKRQRWLATASVALGLVLVVAASYHLAHGNDQLVRLLSRGGS